MSELRPMFSHPVMILDDYPQKEALAEQFYAKAIRLMQEYPDAGLISDAWHTGSRARSSADYKRHGFTSFYNVNLGKREDFSFMNQAAMEVFSQYLRAVGRSGLGMRLDNAWASVYGQGHYVPQHTHPLSHLSMVFYASATKGTGQIVFDNPARGHFEHFYPPEISWLQPRASIQPETGFFIVFPSYLIHHTDPHESDAPRVIYSANVQLKYQKTTDAELAESGRQRSLRKTV